MVKHTLAIIALGALIACSTGFFPYKYYGLQLPDPGPGGALLGPKPEDDLPITECVSGATSYPCVVMKQEVFFEMKRKFIEIDALLKACQGGN